MKANSFDEVKIQFEKFLSVFRNVLTSENEINIIQNKLRRRFNTTRSGYLCSNEFISLLNHMHNLFVDNKKSAKYYTELASFDEQLKKNSIKSSRPHSSSTTVSIDASSTVTSIKPIDANDNITEASPVSPPKSTIEYETSIAEVQETIDHLVDQCCTIVSVSIKSRTHFFDNKVTTSTPLNSDRKNKRKVIKLERRLSRLSRIIRELEEKDMSLDEMAHCDLYVVESNLKKQACEIHSKIAKLKSQTPTIERIIHQPIVLSESEIGHPLINKNLEEMVNQAKHFPSFSDILDTVEKVNDKHKLNLDEEACNKFAEKSFKIIGRKIKDRRMADFNDIMYSRLPADFNIEQDDPALHNVEIEKVLSENHREALIKTEKIFEEFSQIEPNSEVEANVKSTEEESVSEQEEETITIAEVHEVQYDVVDIVAPLSLEPAIHDASESNSNEAVVEISLNDRALTILSTAALPMKKTPTRYRESEIYRNSQESSTVRNDSQVETLIPRRKQNVINNEIIYSLYKQRLTNNVSPVPKSVTNKRPTTINTEYSTSKKSKQQSSEIIVLD
ncbi:unnamed protein product [Rotaria socialis]|uniref:Daxx histone-binding domain-containing protein n=1 Tax=Rotaria socialis TaxID=392032 RepID=A0A820UJK5_9BILA|nr:unnamed protein product [Rotaria socialis]